MWRGMMLGFETKVIEETEYLSRRVPTKRRWHQRKATNQPVAVRRTPAERGEFKDGNQRTRKVTQVD